MYLLLYYIARVFAIILLDFLYMFNYGSNIYFFNYFVIKNLKCSLIYTKL